MYRGERAVEAAGCEVARLFPLFAYASQCSAGNDPSNDEVQGKRQDDATHGRTGRAAEGGE